MADPDLDPSSREDLVSLIEDQHDDIRSVVDALQATDDVRAVAGLLAELEVLLQPHFAEEERPGGMLESIGDSVASRDRVVAAIRSDHLQLTNAAHEAIRATRACLDGPVADVLAKARDLCARIQSHERRESEAFLAAVQGESTDNE